jgi:methyltransferase
MTFGWGAALLAFITAQRVAELWWARENERRLFAAGGIEFGRSHLFLIVLLHAAWIIGVWTLGYDRSINPFFLVVVALLQIARFWVLITLGRRWTIRIIAVPGERLVARGPYRFLRHPIMRSSPASSPPFRWRSGCRFMRSFLRLAIRIPEENAALAAAARVAGPSHGSDLRGSPMVG